MNPLSPIGRKIRSSERKSFIAILCVLLFFYGCDIFQPRDPQPPTQGTSSYRIPDRPEVVLENLKSAIAESNTDNYLRSFADTASSSLPFIFIPSSEVSSVYASVFQTWDITNERIYFQNLGKPDNLTPRLDFSNPRQSSNNPDSVIYTMDYVLEYPHHRQGVPQILKGNMQILLKPDSRRLWFIQTWLDTKTRQDSTWSYIKAVFSAN